MTATGAPRTRRYFDLLRLFVRYGRTDLVSSTGFDEFDIDDDAAVDDAAASALADDLEGMGPTYVKLGQLLSTRFDLLPQPYTEALARLQDSVEPFPFDQVRETVETELGAQLRHLFTEFDETPLASASIGQVHRAVTRSGRDVVVKVQRPGIRDVVREDMRALEKLAGMADSYTGAGRRYGFAQLLAQFRRSLAGELDYVREARNLQKFGKLTEDYPHIVVPQPISDYTTAKVLTMERVEGRNVTDISPLGLTELDTAPLVEELFACYLRMILDLGVLHADPHPGNLLLTSDGRIALLDLGMVATVPPRVQDKIVRLLLAISDGDGEETAQVLASMGHPLEDYDAAKFREDVSHLVSESMAMGSDLQTGSVLVELSRLSGAHGLRPPAEMAMVGKALLNLDQATVHLDPTFSPTDAIRDNVSSIMRSGLAVSPGGVMAAALEAKEFAAQLPRRANRILDALSDGELTVRVNAFDENRLLTVLQRLANRLTMGVVLASIVVGAALMMQVPTRSTVFGYPAIAMVFFLLAALGGAVLVVWIVATDRKIARRAALTERRRTGSP